MMQIWMPLQLDALEDPVYFCNMWLNRNVIICHILRILYMWTYCIRIKDYVHVISLLNSLLTSRYPSYQNNKKNDAIRMNSHHYRGGDGKSSHHILNCAFVVAGKHQLLFICYALYFVCLLGCTTYKNSEWH